MVGVKVVEVKAEEEMVGAEVGNKQVGEVKVVGEEVEMVAEVMEEVEESKPVVVVGE